MESPHTFSGLSLSQRVALVTGSGRGIGAATALLLAQRGADIIVNDISPENAQMISDQIHSLGRRAWISHHDVSHYEAASELVRLAQNHFGRIDILVNNAGITRDSLLHKLSEKSWDEVIRVNLKGPFNVGQACAKVMMEQKYGRIINVSSVAKDGNVGQTNYSASKAGVVGMTQSWAIELAKYNITVNAVAPGLIDSVLTQQIPGEIKERFISKIPAKRIGNPNDIAQAIAFLASPDASYLTGQCITVDGGLTTGIAL